LDSAVILYNQRPDSLDIALANVMVYTLSANIDNADSAMGELPWRRLKDFGYYSFNLSDQQLRFPGSDTLPKIPVRQYWERRGTKIICIEYVMMSKIKKVHEAYPSATIWHNDIKVIEGTTNVEDAKLDFGFGGERNYGASVNLYVDRDDFGALIRVKNVAAEIGGGATISAAVCSLYCYGGSAFFLVGAYSVFKPWNEGNEDGVDPADAPEGEGIVTFNDWSNDDEEWTTAGCNSADDDGVDNSGDGTGADRKATPEDTEDIVTGTWFGFDMSSALAQAWYDGTKYEEGVLLKSISGDYGMLGFRSTEAAEVEKPFWVFTYTIGEIPPTAAGQVIIIQQ